MAGMKKNILIRTNLVVCLVISAGFFLTATLSYRTNYSASITNIEQVSTLTSEGIYAQMTSTFSKPVNISLTMANDSLLKALLAQEASRLDDPDFVETLQGYLAGYRDKYGYDSVFLVSTATNRYYNFNGLDRVLTPDNPENDWYFDNLSAGPLDYWLNVDNDEVAGADNEVTVFVDCKIRDESGALLGVVGVGVLIQSLQQLLQGYQDDFDVNAYFIDGDGTIQVSSTHSGYESVSLFDIDRYDDDVRQTILSWLEEGEACSFWAVDQSDSAQKNFVVSRYLPELGWHLVVERNTGALVSQLNRQLLETLLIILAIIAVILIVITCVIRTFNRRIVALARTVEQEKRSVFEQATEELFEHIYELDITHNRPANPATMDYFRSLGVPDPENCPYDRALRLISAQQIKPEFRQGYLDTFAPDHVLQAYEQGRETLRYEFMISTDGQDYYWMRITARIVRLESDGSIHLLVYRQNIDAEKRRERRMEELAQTDEMTGLLTKSATRRQIEARLLQAPEAVYALFIFDIDHFKQANDQFGHAFGDEVIRAFARTLQQHFRREDLLGRIGGDEFVAFLPISDGGWAMKKAAELSAALDQTFTLGGNAWAMTASIGVALTGPDCACFDALYRNADAALYETKRRGRNAFTLYTPGQ